MQVKSNIIDIHKYHAGKVKYNQYTITAITNTSGDAKYLTKYGKLYIVIRIMLVTLNIIVTPPMLNNIDFYHYHTVAINNIQFLSVLQISLPVRSKYNQIYWFYKYLAS